MRAGIGKVGKGWEELGKAQTGPASRNWNGKSWENWGRLGKLG